MTTEMIQVDFDTALERKLKPCKGALDRSLALALGVKGSGAYWSRKRSGGAELPEYIAANYLTPYISEEQRLKLLETVVYTDKDGEVLEGVSANLLVEICDIWQKADKKGALDRMPNAKKAAHNAYIIFKGVAHERKETNDD